MRDPEIIRRDIQIATLMAENVQLRAERDLARATAQIHEMAEARATYLEQRDAFVAELNATRQAANPPPPVAPPSGAPLVVEDPVAPRAP